MEQEESNKLDLSGLGSFNFTPDWAKKDAGVKMGKVRPEREERKPMGDGKKSFGDKRPMGERPAFKKNFERRPRQFEERPKPLDVEVQVLPETKALGTIIRKLQSDTHAYKLKELAYFFLENPTSILLKVVPKGEDRFYQCKACGFAALKESEVLEHLVTVHLNEYFDAKEIEVEPPKGNFNCVAKCGLSGVLLGPPNIHEFNSVVREMIRTRYPEMSEAQYRAHIEMVRDAESIEAWRKSAVKKTVYFAKGQAEAEGAAQYTREQAEGEFKRNYMAQLVDSPKNLMITAEQAMKSPVKPLIWAARDAIEAERRAPYGMCFALRGAFHHRKLKFFRANDSRGPEFVTNMDYKSFDAEHAIPELATAWKFVVEHPCCDVKELPEGEMQKHLQWLVSTGHVVAFTNGVYSAVEKFPKYGPQWKKRSTKKAEAAPMAEEKPAVEDTQPVKPEAAPTAEAKTEVEAEVTKEEEKQNEVAAKLAE